ncbi:GntR family transcriptional regulator [Agromyces sp. MMS24-JH15]|uniref:GntR family transcriptional regulator n=1 Tax=Agromyces sp. MMS24-JH15 TaxID=3243765 RepID=UPI003749EA96
MDRIVVDPASPTAPYEQIRAAVVDRIRHGDLAPGARLPTVRALAEELGLAVNTVARAYRELEGDHQIETRGRAGTFVSAHGDAAHRELQQAAAEFAALARRLQIPPDDALETIDRALRIGT